MTENNSKNTAPRKTSVRILALIGVALLAALYVTTLILALSDSPNAGNLLMASIAATILIPVLIYTYQFIYRLIRDKKNGTQTDGAASPSAYKAKKK